MNTCKNCKHWQDGICEAPQSDIVKRRVPAPEYFPPYYDTQETKEPNGFAIDASADDDSNLQSHLVTGPDFGCVRFVQKGT